MHVCEQMPFEPTASCPVCGGELDELRAPRALAFDDGGLQLVCSPDCAARLRDTRKQGKRATPAVHRRPGTGDRGEELTQLHQLEPVPLPAKVQLPALHLGALAFGAVLASLPSLLARSAALAIFAASACASLLQSHPRSPPAGPRGLLLAGAALLWGAAALDELSSRYLLAAGAVAFASALRPWLVARARAPVQSLASGLVSALPKQVRVPLDEVEDPASVPHRELAAHKVHTGDVLLLREGETVAVDGVVQVGRLVLLATPNSKSPVQRGVGDSVLAGARVVSGAASVLATGVGDARSLARAARASGVGSRIGGFGQLVLETPVVFAYAAGAAVLAWLTCDDATSALGGIGVTLSVYPLLGLTEGLALRAFAARVCGTQLGMVFRDSGTLEDAGRISAAALMADGTVTFPERLVTEVLVYGRDYSLEELTSVAMGLQASCEEHPIAQAIAAYGAQRSLLPRPVRRASHSPGRGVTALSAEGKPIAIGNRPLLLSAGVSVAVAERDAQAAEASGRSAVFLSVDDRVRALFVVDYQIRPQARSALQELIDLGADVALLSGDHRATVESFADKLDITHVKAELNRNERAAEVARLREAGGLVAAIGRLPEDEAALAEADVAVALNGAGGAAADIALALASDDIADAARALSIAHTTHRRQGWVLAASLGASGVASLAALLAIGPLALWPLVQFGVEAWALPGGGSLLARLKRVGVVGSGRPAARTLRGGSTQS